VGFNVLIGKQNKYRVLIVCVFFSAGIIERNRDLNLEQAPASTEKECWSKNCPKRKKAMRIEAEGKESKTEREKSFRRAMQIEAVLTEKSEEFPIFLEKGKARRKEKSFPKSEVTPRS